jgi:uncharacterized membrane protein YuzA (DUF378 family)
MAWGKLDPIVTVLMIAAAINWGLVGLFDLDIVHLLFGRVYLDRIIYILFGVAGGWRAYCLWFRPRPR